MDLKGKRIGLVSPGGEIRAFFNAGVFHGLMEAGLHVSRIAGTSGGIMCLLPYFQSATPKDFDLGMERMIRRELFSGNPVQGALDYFTPKIFHHQMHPDFSLDVKLDEHFIAREYLNLNPVSKKQFSSTDLVVALTAITEECPIESRRFNVSSLCLEGHESKTLKAAKIVQAGASIFSVSDPVTLEGEGNKTVFLDGFYADNVPLSQMFEDEDFNSDNHVDAIFLINNSNLKNFKSFVDILMDFRKSFGGIQRYSLQYKQMLHYIETSMILSGSDKEQIDLTILMNRMIRGRLEESGKKPQYGQKIRLREYGNKEFTFKPFFIIEPQELNRDIELLVSGTDSQDVARQNYELGQISVAKILAKIQEGSLEPY